MHQSFPAPPAADQDLAASFALSGRLPPQGQVGAMLVGLRVRAGLSQRAVATRLGVHQTCISRMERGRRGIDTALLRRYLHLVAEPGAIRLVDAARAPWSHLPQPPLNHPDLALLRRIEDALSLLRGRDGTTPSGAEGLLGERLRRLGEALLDTRYRVVCIGEAGGAARRAVLAGAGLPLPDETAAPGLDCELEVRPGEGFGLEIAPLDGAAVRRRVSEFCQAIARRLEWLSGDARAALPAPPPGLEQGLRNLAGLAQRPAGEGAAPDPAALLAQEHPPARLETEIMLRVAPWRRPLRHLAFHGTGAEGGGPWLAAAIEAVLAGRRAEAPLPARLRATIPHDGGPGPGIVLVAAEELHRPEPSAALLTHLRDPRALVIPCATVGRPSPLLSEVLRRAAEMGVDPAASGRVVEAAPEGAEAFARRVRERIEAIRAGQRAAAAAALDTLDALLDDPAGGDRGGAAPVAPLPAGSWMEEPHVALLQAVWSSPPPALARVVRDAGRAPDLDFAECLAGEAVRQAARRSFSATKVLRRGTDGTLRTVLGDAVADWEGEFLLAVRYHVAMAYGERLDRGWAGTDDALAAAEPSSLRRVLSARLEEWFRRNDDLRLALEGEIDVLWQGIVAERVTRFGRMGSPGN